jgi:hypothetical protein
MGQTYRLVGSQDPSSRIDRVVVEEPSGDSPGKVLELNGNPVELSDEQVMKISSVARLERSDLEEGEEVAEFGPENYPDESDEGEQANAPEGDSRPSPEPQPSQAAEQQSPSSVVEAATAPATPAESTKVSGARGRREA